MEQLNGKTKLILILLFIFQSSSQVASAAFSDKSPCLRGDRKACLSYAKTKGLPFDDQQIAYNLACDGNIAEACTMLGAYNAMHGDVKEGIAMLHHADELGYAPGTGMLGMAYINTCKITQGISYLKKACKGGDADSCKEAKEQGATSDKVWEQMCKKKGLKRE